MERRTRVYILLTEMITGVVQKYLIHKASPNSFEDFLKLHKHTLYHMCFNNTRCCLCGLSPNLYTRQIIRKEQLKAMFDEFNQRVCRNFRNCPCMYEPKSNSQIETLDITLCITILNNCFKIYLSQTEISALDNIRQVRNTVSHVGNNADYSEQEYKDLWSKATTAAIDLAKCVSQQYDKEVQEQISILKTRPVIPIEYTETFRKIAEENSSHSEVLENLVGELGKIRTGIESPRQIIYTINNIILDPRLSTRDNKGHFGSSPEQSTLPFEPLYERSGSNAQKTKIPVIEAKKPEMLEAKNVGSTHSVQYLKYNNHQRNDINTENGQRNKLLADREETRPKVFLTKTRNDISVGDFENNQLPCYLNIEDILIKDSGARVVGKYLRMLLLEKKEQEIIQLFCKHYTESTEDVSLINIVKLLDGLTNEGMCFRVLKHPKCSDELYNTICSKVDSYGNRVVHYLVATFDENERFEKYILRFCKHRPNVMLAFNFSDKSPMDLAAFLGKYKVIRYIIHYNKSPEKDHLHQRIFKHFQLLRDLNKKATKRIETTKIASVLGIDLEMAIGKNADYENMLRLIGKKEDDDMDKHVDPVVLAFNTGFNSGQTLGQTLAKICQDLYKDNV